MSKSAIYTQNSTTQALAVGSTISLGSILRRFGANLNLSGNNSIVVCGGGYYSVNATITLVGTTAGTATVSLFKDGVEYVTSSVSLAVGDVVTIPLTALIREFGCCCDNNSNLTFVLGGVAESISNISVVAERI